MRPPVTMNMASPGSPWRQRTSDSANRRSRRSWAMVSSFSDGRAEKISIVRSRSVTRMWAPGASDRGAGKYASAARTEPEPGKYRVLQLRLSRFSAGVRARRARCPLPGNFHAEHLVCSWEHVGRRWPAPTEHVGGEPWREASRLAVSSFGYLVSVG